MRYIVSLLLAAAALAAILAGSAWATKPGPGGSTGVGVRVRLEPRAEPG